MLAADSLQLAVRAITAQRLRSFLTLLGIAVGIAAVILLTSIGEGIHRFVLGEFTQFGTNVITIAPGKTKTGGSPSGLPSSARPLSLDDAKSLERLPHIVAVTPNVRGNAEVEGNGRTRRTLIYGVNSKLPQIFRSTVQSGQFLPADDETSARAFVVLGSKVKTELFGSENPLGQRLRIGGLHFRIIGVMAPKGQFLGIDLDDMSNPLQAAFASSASFTVGAAVPLLAAAFIQAEVPRLLSLIAASLVTLCALGATGAALGGAPKLKGSLRVLVGGGLAMGITYGIGRLFTINMGGGGGAKAPPPLSA